MTYGRPLLLIVMTAFFALLQLPQARAQTQGNKWHGHVSALAGYQRMPDFLLKFGGDVQESPPFLHGDTEALIVGVDISPKYSLLLSAGRTGLVGYGSWRRNQDARAAFVDGRATGKTTMDVLSIALGAERKFFLSENKKNFHLFVRLLGGAAMLEGKFIGTFSGVFRDNAPPDVGMPGDSVFEPASDHFRRIIPVVDLSIGLRFGFEAIVPGANQWSVEVAPHINQLGFGARAGVDYRFDLPF